MRKFSLPILVILAAIGFIDPVQASERDFYRNVEGKWSGNGEIVAGKYKNTRFTCVFDGMSPNQVTGIDIDGSCRIGIFAQPMRASVERAMAGYSGTFMDGAQGDGLDVVGGRFTGSRLAVDIRRKDLRGVMAARLTGPDKMHVTVSVHVGDKLIPVIGMSLNRVGAQVDRTTTSSID